LVVRPRRRGLNRRPRFAGGADCSPCGTARYPLDPSRPWIRSRRSNRRWNESQTGSNRLPNLVQVRRALSGAPCRSFESRAARREPRHWMGSRPQPLVSTRPLISARVADRVASGNDERVDGNPFASGDSTPRGTARTAAPPVAAAARRVRHRDGRTAGGWEAG
jgi:hypothetical protein